MSRTSHVGEADRETHFSKRQVKQNWNQPPSRHRLILSHKSHRFHSRETAAPCSRGGCWCVLTLPFIPWDPRPWTPHSHPSASPLYLGKLQPKEAWLEGISASDIGSLYISELQLIFNTHSLCSSQTWSPLQTQTPACSVMPLNGSKHSICNISPGKNRRNTLFRQMSTQFFFPRDSLPDCPAGFVILRAQHNSIRINFVIR